MADETKIVILTQKEQERLAHDHGGVAHYGDKERPPIAHQFEGHVSHSTTPKQPLVHMVCWDAEESCRAEVSGRIVWAGDENAPIPFMMTHEFNDPRCKVEIEPFSHSLQVLTELARPFHHAAQMRTPLQVRFCNTWHCASDYTIDVKIGNRSLFSIRLTGATVATPQPCSKEEPCPPPITLPDHP